MVIADSGSTRRVLVRERRRNVDSDSTVRESTSSYSNSSSSTNGNDKDKDNGKDRIHFDFDIKGEPCPRPLTRDWISIDVARSTLIHVPETSVAQTAEATGNSTQIADAPSAAPTWTIPSIGSTATAPTATNPGTIVMDKDMHTIVVGVLIALIVILCIVLCLLVLPWIRLFMRRRASNDKKRIKRRYRTVDWWLIAKVGEG